MDNLARIEEERRKDSSPYKTAACIAGAVAIFEFLEVWAFGWTLLTFLQPESLGLSQNTALSHGFLNITLHEEYTYCVSSYLIVHLLHLFSAVALLWSNKGNKATAFPIFVFTSILTLLLSVAVTIYYFATDKMVFTYFFEQNNDAALASFLVFLYFSRYFFIGWIVKLAIAMIAHKRKEEIDNEKESIEIQTAVDKAFQNVFDPEPEPEEPHVRPETIPDSMRRIPRVTAVAAGATPPPRKQPDESAQNNRTANGHVNRAYERDSDERSPRQDARNELPAAREPRYPREDEQRARSATPRADGREQQKPQQQQPQARDDQRRENGWRESRIPDTNKDFLHAYDRRGDRVPRDGKPPQEYAMREYSRREYPSDSVPGRPKTPALDDGEEYRKRESRYQEHGAGLRRDYKPHASSEDIYRGKLEPAEGYDARSKSPHRTQYGGDKRQQEHYAKDAEEEALRKGGYGDLRGRRQGDVDEPRRGAGIAGAQQPNRRSGPEYEYDELRYRADRAAPPERGRWDNYDARGGHPQQLEANDSRRPRRELENDYDRRADTAREVRPQQRTSAESGRSSYEDYEPSRADSRRPIEDYDRERSSTPTQPLDASRYLRADEDSRGSKKRPTSAYYSREFDYGPGPLGYNVPSPHSRPRSMILTADEDEVSRPGGSGLKREESFVQKIKPRYESSAGGALRAGPAPVGGVPAVGPASLRSRGAPKGRY